MSARERTGSLIGFALLAGFASLHWFALIADPPLWRWAVCVVLALATALALAGLDRARLRLPLALAAVAAAVAAGLLAIGVPARLLGPGAWGELRAELDAGLGGVGELDLPYEGAAAWTRLGILLPAPVVLVAAAAIAYWPGRSGPPWRRAAALALLVALYAVAVTWESPSAELVHGLGLLACVVAYLWLGRLPRTRAFAAAAAVSVAGLAALPAAGQVATADPLINYAEWRIFGGEEVATFDWDHRYGPLDWPQEGTELFEARAERPLYWKTSVLSDFESGAWTRVGGGSSLTGHQVPSALAGAAEDVVARRGEWVESVDVSVAGLRSELLVTSGSTLAVEGIAADPLDPDGVTPLPGAGLERGSSYTVETYAPDPSAALLRRRDDGRYPVALERYTTLFLPTRTVDATSDPRDFLIRVTTPLFEGSPRRDPPGLSATDLVAGTPYARVASLARRLTRGARGSYEAVRAIERYLLENLRYTEDVPERANPLPAFLFKDRAGYCQHFSGAMALMLRLVGIPSRVATGFAPGFLDDPDDGRFVVLDTDAHSWVEVWFPRVGWVTVDPTPSVAPARAESLNSIARTLDGASEGARPPFLHEDAGGGDPAGASAGPAGGGGRSPIPLLFAAVLAAWGYVLWRRRERLQSPKGAGLQLAEFERALGALAPSLPAGVTLLRIERELGPRVGPALERYAAALRNNRYAPRRTRRPGPEERRALRRALARGNGLLGRLRALREIPPGGPRRRPGPRR